MKEAFHTINTEGLLMAYDHTERSTRGSGRKCDTNGAWGTAGGITNEILVGVQGACLRCSTSNGREIAQVCKAIALLI